MADLTNVKEFLNEKNIAVAGASRSGKKFGNAALKELKAKGYNLYPVHPEADELEGIKCFNSVGRLPEKAGGVFICVRPAEAVKVIKDAEKAGVTKIWLQSGAESQEAIDYCAQNNISLVYNKCILMFAEPAGFFHKLHRWFWNLGNKN
jgi:predicted CoA-binding protein